MPGQHPPHLFIAGQPHALIERALRAGQRHPVHLLGQRGQLGGHLVFAAAQDERCHPLRQQPGAGGLGVFLDGGAPVAHKTAGVAQIARQQEMKLRPQLAQVVFHGRAGQAQAVPGVEPARGGGRAAAGVLDHLRFVQDHDMPGLALQGHGVAPQQRVAGEHHIKLWHAGDLGRAPRALQRQQPQGRGHACGLGLPVEDQRGRGHHQRGQVEPASLSLHQQMRQGLGGFAQTHVVGQDARQGVPAQMLQPGQALALIRPQHQAQAGGHGHRRRRGGGLVQPGQAGLALQFPVLGQVAARAGVAGHGVAQAGAKHGKALHVPRRQQQPLAVLGAARLGQQIEQGSGDGLERRGQSVNAPPARRVQTDQGVVGDGVQRVSLGPAPVVLDQPGQQRHQVQGFAAVAGLDRQPQAQHPRAQAARLGQGLEVDVPGAHRQAGVGKAGAQGDGPALGLQGGQGVGPEIAEIGLAHQAEQRPACGQGAGVVAPPLQGVGWQRLQAGGAQAGLGAGVVSRQPGQRDLRPARPEQRRALGCQHRPARAQAQQAVAPVEAAQGQARAGAGHWRRGHGLDCRWPGCKPPALTRRGSTSTAARSRWATPWAAAVPS